MTSAPGSQSSSQPAPQSPDWITRWQRIASRIRVPLGFLTAGVYLFELGRRPVSLAAVAWSLALVLPGLGLRAYAAGYVKKNRELTVTGPYAYTRNPLYLGSMLMAAGFALALESWPVAALLALGFSIIYIPVIAAEERFLRATFAGFAAYSRSVPRLIPRLTPAQPAPPPPDPGTGGGEPAAPASAKPASSDDRPGFRPGLYLRHREYNAAIGAALLYLSLLVLHPALGALFRAFSVYVKAL